MSLPTYTYEYTDGVESGERRTYLPDIMNEWQQRAWEEGVFLSWLKIGDRYLVPVAVEKLNLWLQAGGYRGHHNNDGKWTFLECERVLARIAKVTPGYFEAIARHRAETRSTR